MKITCKQVPPDFVEAPDIIDSFGFTDTNICIWGLNGWKHINEGLFRNVSTFINDMEEGYIPEYFKFISATRSNSDLPTFLHVASKIEKCTGTYSRDLVTEILSIFTGSPWKSITITGSCQGDVAYIFYDTRSIDMDICQQGALETAYFNLGNEFEIIRSDSDISDYLYIYHCHDTDEQKNELLDYIRYSVNTPKNTEIEFLFFDGYNMIPKYRKG